MEQLNEIANIILTSVIAIYAILLMVGGGLFGKGATWANGFATWVVMAPFRITGKILFGKQSKKKKKKKKKEESWFF